MPKNETATLAKPAASSGTSSSMSGRDPISSFQSYEEYAIYFPNMETRHIRRFFDAQFEKNNRANCELVVNAAKALMKWHENVRHEDETLGQLIGDAENRRDALNNLSAQLDLFQRFVEKLPENVFREEAQNFNKAKLSDFSLLEDKYRGYDLSAVEEDEYYRNRESGAAEELTTETAKSSSALNLARKMMASNAATGRRATDIQSENSARGGALASPGISARSATTLSLQRHLPQILRERNPLAGGHHHFPLMNANVTNAAAPGGGAQTDRGIQNQSSDESSSDSSFSGSSSGSTASASATSSSSGSSSSSATTGSSGTTENTSNVSRVERSVLLSSNSTSSSAVLSDIAENTTTVMSRPVGGVMAARRIHRLRAAAGTATPAAAATANTSSLSTVSSGTQSAQPSAARRERRAARRVLGRMTP